MRNEAENSLMSVDNESNINEINYHPFDLQIRKLNEIPHKI